ncbi:MAG: PHP domain-containing protein [Deltaproteobacteria bacterium]|nr:PHP domain-containing protein [Deltaproteobacteria bacterium]
MIDLHTHSTCSDGSFTPDEIVALARVTGLSAVALTDHDSVDGIDAALNVASGKCEVVPGVELSAEYMGKALHITGLYINHKDEGFNALLEKVKQKRNDRNVRILQKLEELGMPVSLDELHHEAGNGVGGRVHLANILVKKGYVKSRDAAFEIYLGGKGLAMVDRQRFTPKECISAISNAGGVSFLAHPATLKLKNNELKTLVAELKSYGLSGIETFYSGYEHTLIAKLSRIAKEFDLVRGGGSDFHGKNRPAISLGTGYGTLYMDDSLLKPIKNLARLR